MKYNKSRTVSTGQKDLKSTYNCPICHAWTRTPLYQTVHKIWSA